jgi:hypothetical protein
MAHFAKLDETNTVIDVNYIVNAVIDDLPFPESEPVGIEFLQPWATEGTTWKQTSVHHNFRKNYAVIGGIYDPIRDAFIAPKPDDNAFFVENTCRWIAAKPYPSWILDETINGWVAPVPYPTDGKGYYWDEATLNWIEVPAE